MKRPMFAGYVPLPRSERTQWDDDKCIAMVTSPEAAGAVARLFPESKWWRGTAGRREFHEPYEVPR